jgi:6-pyruvoyltetrahydropterin/6-carboxytetrahydropterin synthase
MFQVMQRIEFCYGHRLLNYSGKCRFLHGHNGVAEIKLAADELDERGMLVDFTDIKKSLRTWIDEQLDHRMILNENDPYLPVFEERLEPVIVIPDNPTAENIAKLIYTQAKKFGFPVYAVTLWETRNSCATYGDRL